MTRTLIALAGALAATLTGASVLAATQQDQLPGRWEAVTTDLNAKGSDRTMTAHSCVAAGASMATALRSQLGEGCRHTRFNVGGGRIDVAEVCPTGISTVTGSYTPTTLHMAMRGSMRVGKTVLPVNLDVKGRRIAAACTDGDE